MWLSFDKWGDLLTYQGAIHVTTLVVIVVGLGLGPNPTSWWTCVGGSLGVLFTFAMAAFMAIVFASLLRVPSVGFVTPSTATLPFLLVGYHCV